MKKSVLAIVGSPRKGHTYRVAKLFEEELGKAGDIAFEYVLLKDVKLESCRGCGLCLEKGEDFCPLKSRDDFTGLFQKMMNADGIVMATPVYSLQVTALLKNLLDRMAFVMHRPCFFHKLYMPVVTQGVYGADGVIKYLDEAAKFFGFNTCPGLGLTVALKDPLPEETQKINSEVKAAAQRFSKMLANPKDPVPGFKDLLMFRIVRCIHAGSAGLQRDHEYYREKGWFNSNYYYDTKLGPLKRLVGAWADWQGRKMADKIIRDREQFRLTKKSS